MIIVNQSKDIILNSDNITCVSMSYSKTEISAFKNKSRFILATYEDEEVAKTAFNQFKNALIRNDKIFEFPE